MPIYEYECKQCNHIFELLRKFSEADQVTFCPHCESVYTTRSVSKVNAFVSTASGEHKAISGGGGCAGCGSVGGHTCGTCHH